MIGLALWPQTIDDITKVSEYQQFAFVSFFFYSSSYLLCPSFVTKEGSYMKKWFQCIFIVSLLQLTACWDSSNIESLSFVMGVGIEVQEDQEDTIGLLTQLYLPLSDENISSSISYRNKYSTGKSVLDAIRHLELIDQGIMSDHQMILVLDTDAVQKWGVKKLINQKN